MSLRSVQPRKCVPKPSVWERGVEGAWGATVGRLCQLAFQFNAPREVDGGDGEFCGGGGLSGQGGSGFLVLGQGVDGEVRSAAKLVMSSMWPSWSSTRADRLSTQSPLL